MGRPRKRAQIENASSENPKDEQEVQPRPEPQPQLPLPTTFVIPEFDPVMGMDLDLSFMDMSNTDINFLDLLDPSTDFPFAPECSTPVPNLATTTITTPAAGLSTPAATALEFSTASGFWPMGGQIENIDFDTNTYTAAPPDNNREETSSDDVSQFLTAELAGFSGRIACSSSSSPSNSDRVPSLSPPSSTPYSSAEHTSPESSSTSSPSSTTAASAIPQSCSCLASLYLALESLKDLPPKVPQAMRITRAASRVAHDCVLCPVCGDLNSPATTRPPLAMIQSMMMLGAILPSLSNAYMRILTMVDNETSAAVSARQKIKFTLNEYGGLWGVLRDQEPNACGAAERLEGAVLEPSLWRLTVRALLKVDVYGIDDKKSVACHDMRHFGLKDIIGMMEERSRNRHKLLDAMIASGELQREPGYVPMCEMGSRPTCMGIIDLAKRSMNELVIP